MKMLEEVGSRDRANIIIAMTDGEDSDSSLSLSGVVSQIENSTVPLRLYGLAYGGSSGSNLSVLEQMAAVGNSGGRAFYATPEGTRLLFEFLTDLFTGS